MLRKAGSAVTDPKDSSAQIACQGKGTAQTHTDSSLKNGTTYHYALYTHTEAGGYSSAVIASATPRSPPPATLGANGMNTAIRLAWSPVDASSGYNLYYAKKSFSSLTGIDDYTVQGQLISLPNQTETSHKITGLSNGTQYYFVVTAIKAKQAMKSMPLRDQYPSTTQASPEVGAILFTKRMRSILLPKVWLAPAILMLRKIVITVEMPKPQLKFW